MDKVDIDSKVKEAIQYVSGLEKRNANLVYLLQKAIGIIREAKPLLAPNTTNAFVDDWLKDAEKIIGEEER